MTFTAEEIAHIAITNSIEIQNRVVIRYSQFLDSLETELTQDQINDISLDVMHDAYTLVHEYIRNE